MAGIAFWGGFASGMSESIEKNRDRVAKEKAKTDAILAQGKADDAKALENLNKTKFNTEKTLRDLTEKRNKLVDGTWEGTEEEAVELWNDYGRQMIEASNSTNEYAANLGKQPVIDVSGYGIEPIVTAKIEGKSYILDKTRAVEIQQNDDLQMVGNEIYQRAYETTPEGNMIPKVDGNGEPVFEPTGEKLRPLNDVFKSKATTTSTTDVQYQEYAKNTQNPMSKTAWIESQKQTPMLKTIQETTNYSRDLLSGKAEFDLDKAENLEARMQETKSWKAKYDERVQEFDKAVVMEENYNELQSLWTKAVEDGTYKSGILSTLGQNLAEYTGEGGASLVGLSGEEVAKRLNVDTKMGDTVARYVKLISGAAATDKERETLTEIMFGSRYKDEKVRLKKFNSFLEQRRSQNENEAKSLIRKAPATAGRYLFKDKIKGATINGEEVRGYKPSRQQQIDALKKAYPDATDEEINAYVTNNGQGY